MLNGPKESNDSFKMPTTPKVEQKKDTPPPKVERVNDYTIQRDGKFETDRYHTKTKL